MVNFRVECFFIILTFIFLLASCDSNSDVIKDENEASCVVSISGIISIGDVISEKEMELLLAKEVSFFSEVNRENQLHLPAVVKNGTYLIPLGMACEESEELVREIYIRKFSHLPKDLALEKMDTYMEVLNVGEPIEN